MTDHPRRQLSLFDHSGTTGLVCSFGQASVPGTVHAPGWSGAHHCSACAAEVERACAAFAAAVARGEYDAEGYTPAERRRKQTRHAGRD